MFAAILLILALQSPAALQSAADGFPILGKLTRGQGMPPDFQISLIEVQLENDQGQIVDRTMSSPRGDFRFNHVPVGRYWLVIDGEKFHSIRQRLEIDVRTFGVVNVNILLQPLVLTSRTAEEETVSVGTLLRKLPKGAQKAYDKAMEEQRKGRNTEAVSKLLQAIRLAPDFFEAHLQLGLEYQRNGNSVEAMKYLEKAVALNSGSISGQTQLGRLYYESEQYQKAADVLSETVRKAAVPPQAFFYLGSAFYKLNSLEPAEQNLLHTLEIDPDYMAAHVQLCNLYMKMRRPGKALEHLDAYLERFPTAPDRANIQEQADRIRALLKR